MTVNKSSNHEFFVFTNPGNNPQPGSGLGILLTAVGKTLLENV